MICQEYAMIFLTNMDTIAHKILARAKRHGAGWVFSAKHLTDLGDRAAIDQALSRLAKDSRIRRVARGLYDLPKSTPYSVRSRQIRTRWRRLLQSRPATVFRFRPHAPPTCLGFRPRCPRRRCI